MSRLRSSPAVVAYLCASLGVLTAQSGPNELAAREIFKQLVEINTTEANGSTTRAAEAMAERFRAAGFPAADINVFGPSPRKGNLVVRYRGTGTRRPLLLLAIRSR
jgi:acetylornithine deacetylase/succinyl-diaminopimelate desuccinylase-like protein